MPLNHIVLLNGGVGSGKTTLATSLAIGTYKRSLRRWKIKSFFLKLFKKKISPKPLFYSNIPIRDIPFVPLTASLLYGDTNFSPKSVVLFTEVSLSASSMDYNRIDYEKFSKGIKLFRHRTLGGTMFLDTQAVSDMHYILKRSINSYVWIEKFIHFPFILCYKVRNMLLCDENSVNINQDTQKETRLFFCFSRVWNKFDTYNFYGIYENTPIENQFKLIRFRGKNKGKKLRSYDYIKLRSDKK